MPFEPTHPLCQLADVKAALRLDAGDTKDDDRLNLAIDAASRQIESELERHFWQDPAASARLYVAETPFLVEVDDFMTTTGLMVETLPYGANSSTSIVWDPTDYQLEPLNGLWISQPWAYEKVRAVQSKSFPVYGGIAFPQPYVQALVRVTAQWGWSSVPSNIQKAAIAQSISLFKADDVPFGATAFAEIGIVRLNDALHPTCAALIEPYYKDEVWVA